AIRRLRHDGLIEVTADAWLGAVAKIEHVHGYLALGVLQPARPRRCWNSQQPAPRVQPQRSVVVADCGVEHGAGEAVAPVQTSHVPELPVIEPTTGGQPRAAIAIDRQAVANHRAVGGSGTNDDVGCAVSKARELAGAVRDPHAIVLIGAKKKWPADDVVDG